jgi:hypothetical protein
MATINSSGNFKDRNATVITQLMNLDWQNCDHIQRLKVDATILTIYCVCLLVHDSPSLLNIYGDKSVVSMKDCNYMTHLSINEKLKKYTQLSEIEKS